jgi:hypothetical protein
MAQLAPILLVQLVGTAFACGLNLYATVAVVGLGSQLGWIAPLPSGLVGLQHPLVIASAALLYLVEFVVDKVPNVDSIWDTVHTFIRPSAAALLALGALYGLPLEVRLGGAALAGAVALAAHGTKAGLRLTLNANLVRRWRTPISVTEDIVAVAIVIATLRFPAVAFGIATAALGTTLMVGPQMWRAFVFGLRASDARLRRLFGATGWQDTVALPSDIRALVDPPGVALRAPRFARAAVKGLRGVGDYRNGWLVITAGTPTFFYRSWFRPRRLALPIGASEIRPGVWADAVEIDSHAGRYSVFLLKDGPSPDLALADLALAHA